MVNVADRQSYVERSILCRAKHFRQMHAKMNIFYTLLIQNIENGKLHRQVDSVDAGLTGIVTKYHVFFSVHALADDAVEVTS